MTILNLRLDMAFCARSIIYQCNTFTTNSLVASTELVPEISTSIQIGRNPEDVYFFFDALSPPLAFEAGGDSGLCVLL